MSMRTYSSVLEEQEHLGSADLDSCPDCGDAMITRGGEKICAGCGTRQPVITVQAAQHDWSFVAKMAVAVNRHWEKKAMPDMRAVPDRRLIVSPASHDLSEGPVELPEPKWTGDPAQDQKLRRLHTALSRGFDPGPRQPYGWPSVSESDWDWMSRAYPEGLLEAGN